MRVFAWTITILFGALFIYKWISSLTTQNNNEIQGLSLTYVVGLFIGHAIIPPILWVYIYSSKNGKKENNKGIKKYRLFPCSR